MKSLQVIMPVHNEKIALPIVIKEWSTTLSSLKINYEFIICEDGSTDGTQKILAKLANKFPIIINHSLKRRGYGNAMLSGIDESTADYLLCIDSDGQCDPKDFEKFWKVRNTNTILLGERKPRRDSRLRKIYSFMFHMFFKVLYLDNIKDPSSCFMLSPRELMRSISNQVAYSAESFRWGVCAASLKNNISIKELPINHRLRISGTTRVFTLKNIPGIVFRGMKGILQIRFSK